MIGENDGQKIMCYHADTFVSYYCIAQLAKDAYKALIRVQMQAETGVNYTTYRNALVDGKVEVNMFLESPNSQKNPLFIKHLKKALQAYEFANEIWTMKIRGTDSTGQKHYDRLRGQELARFSKTFPSLNDPKFRNTWLYNGQVMHETLEMEQAIKILWGEASKELKSGSTFLFGGTK